MIKARFKKIIHSYMFVNERILQLRYKLQRGYLTLLAVCAPEEGKLNKQKNSMKISKIRKTKQIQTITLSLLEIIMQELEKFLLLEFWTQMVKLLITIMDTN